MRHKVEQAGLAGEVEVESAGTGSWHAGESPDSRATKAARERGYELGGEARQVGLADFEEFDLIVAMDSSNHADLREIAPPNALERIRLLREFGPDEDSLDVPDPYFGAHDGFAEVLGIVERCCEAMLGEVAGDARSG